MKQKDIFLESEGDAWFNRNKHAISSKTLPQDDAVLQEILSVMHPGKASNLKILEIGCGDGTRLSWLKENLSLDCYGIEPSQNAVKEACAKGIKVYHGTADLLPFDNESFDIVIYGFCLYLCDREDLFSIAREADRVLSKPGWLIIQDFYSTTPKENVYHHCSEVLSYKMDYRTLFTWHPQYECLTHKVRHHSQSDYTDIKDEWTAISVIRKVELD